MSLLLEVLLKYNPGNFTNYRSNFKIGRDMLRAINRDLNGEIVVVNYNIWDYILFMWGLEAYIYRKQGDEEKATERIAAMERVWSTPTGKWNTPEMALSQHKAICNRLSFDDAIYREKIERATAEEDKSSANARRFTALYKMIGYGVTGLFHSSSFGNRIRKNDKRLYTGTAINSHL